MSAEPEAPDPLAIFDALTDYREHLRGLVAVFVSDGFTDAQARDLVVVMMKASSAP